MRQAESTLRGRAGSFVGPLYTAIVSRVLYSVYTVVCESSAEQQLTPHVSTLRLVQLHANLLHAPFKRYLDHNWGICLEPTLRKLPPGAADKAEKTCRAVSRSPTKNRRYYVQSMFVHALEFATRSRRILPTCCARPPSLHHGPTVVTHSKRTHYIRPRRPIPAISACSCSEVEASSRIQAPQKCVEAKAEAGQGIHEAEEENALVIGRNDKGGGISHAS